MASASAFYPLVCVALAICTVTLLVYAEEQCIKGKYHLPAPGVGKNFPICQEYSNKTCCTKEFADKLKKSRAEELYNHTWDLCKPLSKPCESFWLQQECFYQCSPNVYQWQHPNEGSAIHAVPICSSVCNGWFEACKNDYICVQDVLTGYEILKNGSNRCPANSTCKTYSNMFKNGKGLCNKMWNTSYVYTTENSDKSNCLVMAFNGTNPNDRVIKPTNPTSTKEGPSASAFINKGNGVFATLGLLVALAI